MKTNIAIIDLGTNTFHLLIAALDENSYEIIHREKHPVKIGKGGINENRITEEGLHRALITLRDFKNKIESYRVTKTFAFGTSALRNALNADRITKRIKDHTGIDVSIISGDREAEFIYWGIQAALKLGQSKSLVMDIGGGSVEFILCNDNEIFWKRSYEIGGQRLMELFHKSDPIKADEILPLNTYFESTLEELNNIILEHLPDTLIGSSGTFDTLSDIFCIKESIHLDNTAPESPLSLTGFHSIYNELITKDRMQRLAIPGMIEMRVDMIVVACCLIRYILKMHEFKHIRVSSYSLKEGALAYFAKSTY